MKKTIILILAVLPIFLLITIDFAGRIIQEYMHIAVERVCFADAKLAEYDENETIKADLGDPKKVVQELTVKIEPVRASDKTLTFSSSDDTVCTVEQISTDEEKGTVTCKVTSLKVGYADLTVISEDNRAASAKITVRVTDDDVRGIALEPSEIDLTVGDSYTLTPTVLSPDALDKVVWYESSDKTIVKVDTNGKATALKAGTVTITATTNDGAFTATCTITAIQGTPAIAFDFSTTDTLTPYGELFLLSNKHAGQVIDLTQYLVVDATRVNIADVKFKVLSGNNRLTSTEDEKARGQITFDPNGKGIVKILAYVGEVENPTYSTEIKIQKL